MPHQEEMIPEAQAARLARDNWNQAADIWEDFVEHGKDDSRELVHGPALLRAVGPVRGTRVLDIGCGQGYFTRKLAARGARIVGVDWSVGMIDRARALESRKLLGIDYRVLDARHLQARFPRKSFDLAVACMSFMDAPGLDQILRGVHQVLTTNGRLVFSITHPMNSSRVSRWETERVGAHGARIVDGYFDEGATPMHWRQTRLKRSFFVPHWHFTLGTWFRKLHQAGFEVSDMAEPRPSQRQMRTHVRLEGPGRVPFWLIVSAQKVSTPPGRGRTRRQASAPAT
ncbi:MAG: class I SAM-dependent methyltransferase [Thermoplasmata archaeon]